MSRTNESIAITRAKTKFKTQSILKAYINIKTTKKPICKIGFFTDFKSITTNIKKYIANNKLDSICFNNIAAKTYIYR